MSIDALIDAIIAVEGGYADNPADRGGPTRYGITRAVARAHGYAGDMRALPIDKAREIYRADYWTGPNFHLVAAKAPRVAAELFDSGVNCGPATAVRYLQRALSVLQGAALGRDGRMLPGGATLTVLDAYLAKRSSYDGEAVLVELLNVFQGEGYAELAERDAAQRTFIFGWIRTRVMTRSGSA